MSRVDCYKAFQPWSEPWAAPAPTSRSVLLDYMTPCQGISFLCAFKNGHYSVAATISSFLLFKLVILVSTTLFVAVPSLLSEPLFIQYRNRCDAANAWINYHFKKYTTCRYNDGEYTDTSVTPFRESQTHLPGLVWLKWSPSQIGRPSAIYRMAFCHRVSLCPLKMKIWSLWKLLWICSFYALRAKTQPSYCQTGQTTLTPARWIPLRICDLFRIWRPP